MSTVDGIGGRIKTLRLATRIDQSPELSRFLAEIKRGRVDEVLNSTAITLVFLMMGESALKE